MAVYIVSLNWNGNLYRFEIGYLMLTHVFTFRVVNININLNYRYRTLKMCIFLKKKVLPKKK